MEEKGLSPRKIGPRALGGQIGSGGRVQGGSAKDKAIHRHELTGKQG